MYNTVVVYSASFSHEKSQEWNASSLASWKYSDQSVQCLGYTCRDDQGGGRLSQQPFGSLNLEFVTTNPRKAGLKLRKRKSKLLLGHWSNPGHRLRYDLSTCSTPLLLKRPTRGKDWGCKRPFKLHEDVCAPEVSQPPPPRAQGSSRLTQNISTF